MKKIIIGMLLVVCSGCAFVAQNFNAQEIEALTLNMTEKEVERQLGKPAQIVSLVIKGVEHAAWRYPVERKFAKKYNALDATYYEILFLDGKVVSWEKAKVYAQPKFEVQKNSPDSAVKTYRFFEK